MSSERFDKLVSYIPYVTTFILVAVYFVFVVPHIQDYIATASGYITAAQKAAHAQEFPRGCSPPITSTDVDAGARRSLHQRPESKPSSPYPRHASTPSILTTELHGPIRDMESPVEEPPTENEPTWLNMPNKRALVILALSRLVDFWQTASL
ncbi:uncharacterized protein M421DRAFT_4826 [Didymella exigua CBS 183.55]|uniref:Uncharacterized protein n=1 Tax=Didymella exigua CBS 183.55 TaxID=1150837 RepID=A0A6A5RNL5_9PLEO|nr:uncharacterized protein M421DRAFT_4826 [Didymella exigua CBS 183.55]KAF1929003.1 hypothetical protein M421DRAFT_4826 [Didymella exigua CBS 183.55]